MCSRLRKKNMMLKISVILACVCLSLAVNYACRVEDSLLISAFNVKRFGRATMRKPDVVELLVKIILRYDVIIIQEIVDNTGLAFPYLVSLVNSRRIYCPYFYDYFTSPRYGHSSQKEQYGYIYRTASVNPLSCFGYPSKRPKNYRYSDFPHFDRQPYIVEFQCLKPECRGFTFNTIVLHASLHDTIEEISGLATVYHDTVKWTGLENAVILGDLNAACNYVSDDQLANTDLKTERATFTWLIHTEDYTNVSPFNPCAYDRIITAGERMRRYTLGWEVYNFTKEFGLDYGKAKRVSDHFPIGLWIGHMPHSLFAEVEMAEQYDVNTNRIVQSPPSRRGKRGREEGVPTVRHTQASKRHKVLQESCLKFHGTKV